MIVTPFSDCSTWEAYAVAATLILAVFGLSHIIRILHTIYLLWRRKVNHD